ncbi:MAG: hypothetical protein HN352_14605 [Bacteroidetes bacterium]|jgi:FKBP-type peptidyl-prolyl cis-trans isomerase|uniref:FKBP-type peptidyl-prolyl cis-trans isomerase n=1 Tax=Desulfobacula sp. TaxID=2593537 RepID=UPI002A05385C|nr:hypothetical protein [Bacteroidota bacterium]MBT6752046.1 hypothetical protein [Desulfobacula sp.]MBT3750673.1 hypothetical protein [Bacteroidota bacterium]MBT4401843.1 hypothetical protein [Bacteroidota bacterium]MBT4409397.1 hypothetical protein [Bacteroidota bacterium]
MNTIKIVSIVVLLALIGSCQSKKVQNIEEPPPSEETLIKINQQFIKEDIDRIKAAAKKRLWDLEETEIGVFYQILAKGDGPLPKNGDEVSFSYRTELLNGVLCYSSDSAGARKFRINYSTVESGWNELSKQLHLGDSVLMVLPPYLGFGLAGDGVKVPPRSILVYHMRLLKIDTPD